ncbi:hypothetical protein AAVH_37519, partial [Aphelenchoides avenae]
SLPSSEAEGTPQAASNSQHTGLLTSARPGANRQQSLSPSIRRSPVNRLKERTADRQGRGRGSSRRDNSPSEARQADSGDSPPLGTASFGTRPARTKQSVRTSDPRRPNVSPREMRLRALEEQVQALRDQLQETKSRLNETQSENERLRYLFGETDSPQLSQLRKCLTAAEADIIKQQREMDVIRQEL